MYVCELIQKPVLEETRVDGWWRNVRGDGITVQQMESKARKSGQASVAQISNLEAVIG